MTVLIADEDAAIVDMLSGFLKKRGLKVVPACDLGQARQTLEQFRIDAVVLDVQQPEGIGSDLRQDLQSGTGTKGIPVIVLSACVDPDELRLAREGGLEPSLLHGPNLELLYLNLLRLQDQSNVQPPENRR